jgi:hypothetical protein
MGVSTRFLLPFRTRCKVPPSEHTTVRRDDSQSETYHFHRLDLTRQAGFIVTIYDEDGLRLANTRSATFSASSRLFDLNGKIKMETRQLSANIVR